MCQSFFSETSQWLFLDYPVGHKQKNFFRIFHFPQGNIFDIFIFLVFFVHFCVTLLFIIFLYFLRAIQSIHIKFCTDFLEITFNATSWKTKSFLAYIPSTGRCFGVFWGSLWGTFLHFLRNVWSFLAKLCAVDFSTTPTALSFITASLFLRGCEWCLGGRGGGITGQFLAHFGVCFTISWDRFIVFLWNLYGYSWKYFDGE